MTPQLEPIAALCAGLAGAVVAIAVVDGPAWLLLPGALGALLPVLTSRRHARRGSD